MPPHVQPQPDACIRSLRGQITCCRASSACNSLSPTVFARQRRRLAKRGADRHRLVSGSTQLLHRHHAQRHGLAARVQDVGWPNCIALRTAARKVGAVCCPSKCGSGLPVVRFLAERILRHAPAPALLRTPAPCVPRPSAAKRCAVDRRWRCVGRRRRQRPPPRPAGRRSMGFHCAINDQWWVQSSVEALRKRGQATLVSSCTWSCRANASSASMALQVIHARLQERQARPRAEARVGRTSGQ